MPSPPSTQRLCLRKTRRESRGRLRQSDEPPPPRPFEFKVKQPRVKLANTLVLPC